MIEFKKVPNDELSYDDTTVTVSSKCDGTRDSMIDLFISFMRGCGFDMQDVVELNDGTTEDHIQFLKDEIDGYEAELKMEAENE